MSYCWILQVNDRKITFCYTTNSTHPLFSLLHQKWSKLCSQNWITSLILYVFHLFALTIFEVLVSWVSLSNSDFIQYSNIYFGMLNHLLIIWIFNMIRLGADKMNLLTLATISHDAAGTFQDLPGFFLCCCSINFSHNPHNGTTSNNLKEHNPLLCDNMMLQFPDNKVMHVKQ